MRAALWDACADAEKRRSKKRGSKEFMNRFVVLRTHCYGWFNLVASLATNSFSVDECTPGFQPHQSDEIALPQIFILIIGIVKTRPFFSIKERLVRTRMHCQRWQPLHMHLQEQSHQQPKTLNQCLGFSRVSIALLTSHYCTPSCGMRASTLNPRPHRATTLHPRYPQKITRSVVAVAARTVNFPLQVFGQHELLLCHLPCAFLFASPPDTTA
jgi:hypothetical protein